MTNIAKLLKDAPKGMKLYSPLLGEVEFAEVMDTDYVPIRVMCGTIGERFDEFGRYKGNEYPNAECLLFPSKDCRTWECWKVPVEPCFKVGDSLQSGSYFTKILSINLEEGRYYCNNRIISFENQDLWHLVPKPHYDISNFKSFDKVLVRDNDRGKWRASIFSYHIKGRQTCYPFCCIGNSFSQCIPFEGNEHLLGTTDMPSDEFINW